MRLASLSLFILSAVSGCVSTRWSVVDPRPIMAVTVAPAEIHGPVDRVLVTKRRAAMIGALRAHGYQVLDAAAPGVPTLTMKIDGTMVYDSQLHAPDDPRHHIYNELHYQFVAYDVHLDVVDASGRTVACGSATSNQDPEAAVSDLTARLVRDVPAAPPTFATR